MTVIRVKVMRKLRSICEYVNDVQSQMPHQQKEGGEAQVPLAPAQVRNRSSEKKEKYTVYVWKWAWKRMQAFSHTT